MYSCVAIYLDNYEFLKRILFAKIIESLGKYRDSLGWGKGGNSAVKIGWTLLTSTFLAY